MTHVITCPECGKNLQVPSDLLDTNVQCPECKVTFVAELPEPPALPPPAAPSRSTKAAWDEKKTGAGNAKKTRRRREDDDEEEDDDYDDVDRRRSRDGRGGVPGQVTVIGVMSLIGGVVAILMFFVVSGSSGGLCCLWPGTYYSMVLGVMAIVKGASLLGSSAQLQSPPFGLGVMMIINIINFDVINVVLGILVLVFSNDEDVKNYLAH